MHINVDKPATGRPIAAGLTGASRSGFLTVLLILLATLTAAPLSGCSSGEQAYAELRKRMVRGDIASRGVTDPRVLDSMNRVPRHLFVPEHLKDVAYIDSPLPIGEDQTISQPYIVALMTESLALGDSARVLEIGTGSGYQAAVLSGIADSVWTIEIIPALAERAAALLDTLGYANVTVRAGDGYFGWPEKAPFDGIMVTAAAPQLPPVLADQLRIGGRLVIPVGDMSQRLNTYLKTAEGLELLTSVPVRFVPMTGRIREENGK
jgi:protein-L-isoaspartate(D-aspartate) O-methyltransferase